MTAPTPRDVMKRRLMKMERLAVIHADMLDAFRREMSQLPQDWSEPMFVDYPLSRELALKITFGDDTPASVLDRLREADRKKAVARRQWLVERERLEEAARSSRKGAS